MPSYTDSSGKRHLYATEEELLEFANKMRWAGNANPLEALMPSEPSDPHSCLIANAVNFESRVLGLGKAPKALKRGDNDPWAMHLPYGMTKERAQKIADAVGCPLAASDHLEDFTREEEYNSKTGRGFDHWAIVLPTHIGNAASAFDFGVGWTVKYDQTKEEANA